MLLPATLRMMIISEPHDCFILVFVALYFHHFSGFYFVKELGIIPLDYVNFFFHFLCKLNSKLSKPIKGTKPHFAVYSINF